MPVATRRADAVGVAHWGAGAPAWRDDAVEGQFEIGAGAGACLALIAAYAEPLVLPARAAIAARLKDTIRFWEQWSSEREYSGPWADLVQRSALVLKLLILAPSGASV